MAPRSYPLGRRGSVGGTPYKGSHGATAPNNWESRNAYDLDVPVGTPVYAVTAGTIGSQIGSLHSDDPKMAGLRLHLEFPGNEAYYAHLSKIVVQAGEHVVEGQLLGYSGEANGVAHLHFAVKNGDPAAWFGGKVRPGASDTSGVQQQPEAQTPLTGSVTPPVAGTGPVAGPPPESTQQPVIEPGAGPGAVGDARWIADSWNRIASQPGSSPASQTFAEYSQIAAGG